MAATKEKSALESFAEMPRIGSAFGGDFLLGYTHQSAITFAYQTLADKSLKNIIPAIHEILNVFENWKNELGVYPPNPGGLFGLGIKQEPAKSYCNRMGLAAALKNEKIKLPDPWECCPYISSPAGMFWKLFDEQYTPLRQWAKTHFHVVDQVLAFLIIMSNKKGSEWQSVECIHAAIRLASFKLIYQENFEPRSTGVDKETDRKMSEIIASRTRGLQKATKAAAEKRTLKASKKNADFVKAVQALHRKKGEGWRMSITSIITFCRERQLEAGSNANMRKIISAIREECSLDESRENNCRK